MGRYSPKSAIHPSMPMPSMWVLMICLYQVTASPLQRSTRAMSKVVERVMYASPLSGSLTKNPRSTLPGRRLHHRRGRG